MDINGYLIFIVASIILCVVPGPDMIYLLSRSIAQGKRAGIVAAIGINSGAYVHLTAAISGLSVILATSSFAFSIVKWLGAVYLILIGLQAIFTKNQLDIDRDDRSKQRLRVIFWQGFLSDVLNPKVAIFFLAFLPQFIIEDGINPTLQLIVLGVTVNIIAISVNILLVYFSSLATEGLRTNSQISVGLKKLMGTLFVILGIRLAYEKM